MRGNEHQREQRIHSLSSTRDAQEQCNQKLSHMPCSPAHHAPQLLGPGFSCQRVPGPARAPPAHTPPHTPLTNHPEVRPSLSSFPWGVQATSHSPKTHLSPQQDKSHHSPCEKAQLAPLLAWQAHANPHNTHFSTPDLVRSLHSLSATLHNGKWIKIEETCCFPPMAAADPSTAHWGLLGHAQVPPFSHLPRPQLPPLSSPQRSWRPSGSSRKFRTAPSALPGWLLHRGPVKEFQVGTEVIRAPGQNKRCCSGLWSHRCHQDLLIIHQQKITWFECVAWSKMSFLC